MNKEEKLKAIGSAFKTHTRTSGDEYQAYSDDISTELKVKLSEIQEVLDVGLDASYGIMSEACDIVGDKDLEYLEDEDRRDLYADCDGAASVYTAVQLSYLNMSNEDEISELMADEAITSIAQACAAWHAGKVREAAEALLAYILE